ncbi:pyrroline-5-carboxylate reductase [Pelotomaculum propionicicum]|uniref:Pyrroline-5-carboxylate reductase n=1 Tax=Pelotomaculum propionicicum TaxID=258475 RepID=A0A4Y7RNB9_9FIRM|nr:pyrroline-5-carboxylate reductase [Pelotomaculum propionicicum]NLI12870.1 pyrroline-5-carboxylate reductase [Peptococcaceae bacterium]TEB10296.1 Pyrroline-5-carboxylate reductase [Pelotomaculum propionicicum]
MPLKGQKIGFLGGGAMGEALLTGLVRTGLAPSALYVSDISAPRLDYLKQKLGVNITTDNVAMVQEVDIVILAVKPHLAADVLKNVAAAVRPGQTFISIAAGITTGLIESYLEGRIPVVRVMPNTPCLVGEGASAVSAGKYAAEDNVAMALAVFGAAGKAVEVPETLLDCVTGLSGSGPAYMYMILEGFIDGAVHLGLPRQVARELMAQTMLGAARMVLDSDEHLGKLRDQVTTPGGTTIAGLFAMEEGALRSVLMKTVAAAAQRSRELSG